MSYDKLDVMLIFLFMAAIFAIIVFSFTVPVRESTNWTIKAPTESGYYWVTCHPDLEPKIIRVIVNDENEVIDVETSTPITNLRIWRKILAPPPLPSNLLSYKDLEQFNQALKPPIDKNQWVDILRG